ncbi:oxidoreductase [Penicillium macrosclerotiorum]|uniref:oxidoreductase n=1 Tax=Penicillium macrosclerotiorum TaxID=303699 RepID=UPI002548360C|nr:oxidoreductase [Penicillium macrosclerotiorum]KAJ5692439.1 oxidoreductase [Penicillium macrosclerotiorum]
MSTIRAILVKARGHAVMQSITLPMIPDDYILVKTKAVALNPTDWKHIYLEDCTDTLAGCDYAGVVEAIGATVSKEWKKGDRVAGFVHGCNPVRLESGAFSEYVLAKGDIQFRIPDYMSFDAASTLGVGLTTVGQNLYQHLELPMPQCEGLADGCSVQDPAETILIYGGATATGSLAIQFAKLSGLRVVTTCSQINQSYMYDLGADIVFDYHDPQVGDRIRDETDDTLELAFDTISTPQSAAICANAISSAGGNYAALLDVRCPRADVDTQVSMAYAMIGEKYHLGGKVIDGKSSDLQFAMQWTEEVETLLQARCIHPHRYHVKPGGLEGVLEGLKLLREGKVRACKLVYHVNEIE